MVGHVALKVGTCVVVLACLFLCVWWALTGLSSSPQQLVHLEAIQSELRRRRGVREAFLQRQKSVSEEADNLQKEAIEEELVCVCRGSSTVRCNATN